MPCLAQRPPPPNVAEQTHRRPSAIRAKDLTNAPRFCCANSLAPKHHTRECSVDRSPLVFHKLIDAQAPKPWMVCRMLPAFAAQTHRRPSTVRTNDLSNAPHRCCANSSTPKHRRRECSDKRSPLLLRNLIDGQASYARTIYRTLPHWCFTNSSTLKHRRRGWSVACFPLLLRKLIDAQAPYARTIYRTLPIGVSQTHRRTSTEGVDGLSYAPRFCCAI